MESGLRKQAVIQELCRSEHGNLSGYVPMGLRVGKEDPEFLARLIAWNATKGAVRDTKTALPVIALSQPALDPEYAENAYAHLLSLDPRNLLRAVRFTRDPALTWGSSRRKTLAKHVEAYLRAREGNPKWFQAVVLQHRNSLKSLYALHHIKPAGFADQIVMKGEKVGVFKKLAMLGSMSPSEAAATIVKERIPFLAAQAVLGPKMKEPDVVLALIQQMSPTELVTNVKWLEAAGMRNQPILRAAFEAGIKRASKSTANVLKTSKAAEVVKDEALAERLKGAQEKQLKALGGVEGDWLVLGDRSGSMAQAIAKAKEVAAFLAKMVKGKVHLVFFDTAPTYYDVSGKDLDEIQKLTRGVRDGGSTSIGCGLQYMLDRKLSVDGIAIVTDGGENAAPVFASVYRTYAEKMGVEPTIYVYQFGPDSTLQTSLKRAGIDYQQFEITAKTDYYALPNLVQTMRVQRYSLIDEIMQTPLLTLNEVLKEKNDGNARQAA